MTEQEFPNGIIFKGPHAKAPEFVKGKISIKLQEFIQYAEERVRNGWINFDVKESRNGNLYLTLDTWEPNGKAPKQMPMDEEIAF